MPTRRLPILILTVLVGLTGCRHVGPQAILDDRIPYNDAVLTTWKQQTLLNIVRLRYVDVPEFIDVPSVVGGHENSGTATGSFGAAIFPSAYLANALTLGLGGARNFADRPTISYTPQTGSQFTRNLTNPLPPAMILNLIESGTPADVVMELAVESINGVRNRGFTGEFTQEDPDFRPVIRTLRKAQASGLASFRVTPAKDKGQPDLLLAIRAKNIPPELAKELDEMRKALHLDPEIAEFKVVIGMLPQAKDEIAFRTRSVFKIMTYLALHVEVPEKHLVEGRALNLGDTTSSAPPQMVVHSGCKAPCDCYTAVRYKGYEFWIDDRDFNSKRSMLYLRTLLALADTDQKAPAPALTIRAN